MALSGIDSIITAAAAGQKFRNFFYKLSGAQAQIAGCAYDLTTNVGVPGNTNVYSGSALTATVPDDTVGWGIYHGGNVSTSVKNLTDFLAMTAGATSAPGMLLLVDICMYYPGVDLKSTSLQTMTNVATLTRYTDGLGLRPVVLVTTQTGNPSGTPVMSVFNYRDQADNDAAYSGMTINFKTGGTNIPFLGQIVPAALQANCPGPFLPLNAGDTGIKRVNSFQLSTAYGTATTVTGCIALVKELAMLPIGAIGAPAQRSFLSQMPTIVDDACLGLIYFPGAATAANSILQGHIEATWG
jgi:hypothetical protein